MIEEKWVHNREQFRLAYEEAFPDSIGAKPCRGDPFDLPAIRRFPCTCYHPQTRQIIPLPSLICPIIIPQEMCFPATLLHWINCISFTISTKQDRSNHIPHDGMKNPSFVLAARRGPPQDHAILLCCILLGCKKNAYVVKGTIFKGDRLQEHTWVMTLESEGQITFWETTCAQRFHLPKRWSGSDKATNTLQLRDGDAGGGGMNKSGELGIGLKEEESDALGEPANLNTEEWEGEVKDNLVCQEDLDLLPVIGRAPRGKSKAKPKAEREDRDSLKRRLMERKAELAFAPQENLLVQGETLFPLLPYDSVEVIFNHENCWANLQNHHPACISYDIINPARWDPFLDEAAKKKSCPRRHGCGRTPRIESTDRHET